MVIQKFGLGDLGDFPRIEIDHRRRIRVMADLIAIKDTCSDLSLYGVQVVITSLSGPRIITCLPIIFILYRYMALFGAIRRYSTLFDAIRRHSVLLDAERR